MTAPDPAAAPAPGPASAPLADVPALEVRATPVTAPEALELIAGSEAELASIYPPDVRFAFSPQELVEAQVHFVVAWAEGEPAACGGFAPLAGHAARDRRGQPGGDPRL